MKNKRIAWNKGKKGIYNKKTLRKLSLNLKKRWQNPQERKRLLKSRIGKYSAPETAFKKGFTPWNKGKKGLQIAWNKNIPCSQETKKRISKANTGRKQSKEWIAKRIKNLKGKKRPPFSKEWKMNMSKGHKGKKVWSKDKKFPLWYRKKISKGHIGLLVKEKNPNWQGGISFEPYGIEFNDKLKEKIRGRDKYRCQECFRHQDELFTKAGNSYKLIIHHIDYNKQNNNSDNLISLCRNCHLQTNYQRKDWTKYFKQKIKN